MTCTHLISFIWILALLALALGTVCSALPINVAHILYILSWTVLSPHHPFVPVYLFSFAPLFRYASGICNLSIIMVWGLFSLTLRMASISHSVNVPIIIQAVRDSPIRARCKF